ncbi:hypothetical protein CgunFtcFv8_009193 [Champsocephalus gunnari]|uniref:Uncharacterized protein n=1 Tax=Champsocephalus gunnari TaxID=52237 RepID=A0AAN8C2A6_CHAGU|nr:hypothetical protein CgunFtcFv8_009193 [Champsocephalus gunnari]
MHRKGGLGGGVVVTRPKLSGTFPFSFHPHTCTHTSESGLFTPFDLFSPTMLPHFPSLLHSLTPALSAFPSVLRVCPTVQSACRVRPQQLQRTDTDKALVTAAEWSEGMTEEKRWR